MRWKNYSNLVGHHAVFSPSAYAWLNYSDENAIKKKIASYAAPIGTALHEYASKSIGAKFRMKKTDKHSVLRYLSVDKGIPQCAIDIDRLFPNLMLYVNDCIGFDMSPEVILYFSEDFYGTADAINYDERNKSLKIFDLKTGLGQVKFDQLEIYASLFCLDYRIKPSDIKELELRIYQNEEIQYYIPGLEEIDAIIDRIHHFDGLIRSIT